MKKVFKGLTMLWGVLFLLGVIWYIVFLHSLPTEAFINLNQYHILLPSYLLLACGMLSFIFGQVFGGTSTTKEVVYVDRIIQKKEEEKVVEKSSFNEISQEALIMDGIDKILQGPEDSDLRTENVLFFLAAQLKAGQGLIYKTMDTGAQKFLIPAATYAYSKDKEEPLQFEYGEGLAGLAAKENKFMLLEEIPQGYVKVFSGLGSSSPGHLLILPLVKEDKVTGVLELGLFEKPKMNPHVFFKELSAKLGNTLFIQEAAYTEKQNHLAC